MRRPRVPDIWMQSSRAEHLADLRVGVVVSAVPGMNRIGVRIGNLSGRSITNVVLAEGVEVQNGDRVLIAHPRGHAGWVAVTRVLDTNEYGLDASQTLGESELHPPNNFTVLSAVGAVVAQWDAFTGSTICWEVQHNTAATSTGASTLYTRGSYFFYNSPSQSATRWVRVRAVRYDVRAHSAYYSRWSDWQSGTSVNTGLLPDASEGFMLRGLGHEWQAFACGIAGYILVGSMGQVSAVAMTGDGGITNMGVLTVSGIWDRPIDDTGLSDGDVLQWNQGVGHWIYAAMQAGSGVSQMSDLTDVSIPEVPTDDDALTWDSSLQRWIAERAKPGWENVHIVAESGGDYTSISSAVSAASAGDVILVMPGSYGGYSDIKGLAVIGVARDQVTITSGVTLGANGAELANVTIAYTTNIAGTGSALELFSDVLAQNVKIDIDHSGGSGTYYGAWYDQTSGTGTLWNCDINVVSGGNGYGAAITTTGTLHLFHCRVSGDDADLYRTSGTLKVTATLYSTSSGTITDDYDGIKADDSDTVDGAHADDTPGANEIPILTSNADLDLETSGRHIYIPATREIARPSTGKGVFQRLSDHVGLVGLTDHFTSGVITTGFSWLATTGFDGTPDTLDYDSGGDYLAATDTVSGEYFLAKSITGYWNKSLYARVRIGYNGFAGIRVDNGYGPSDTTNERYMRMYLDHTGTAACQVVASVKDTTGGPTTQTSGFTIPETQFMVLRVYVSGTASPWTAYFYLLGEDGQTIGFYSKGSQTWTPSRIGLFFERSASQNYNMWDWFYHNFT